MCRDRDFLLREFARNPDFPLDKCHSICYSTTRIFKQVQRYRQDFYMEHAAKYFVVLFYAG